MRGSRRLSECRLYRDEPLPNDFPIHQVKRSLGGRASGKYMKDIAAGNAGDGRTTTNHLPSSGWNPEITRLHIAGDEFYVYNPFDVIGQGEGMTLVLDGSENSLLLRPTMEYMGSERTGTAPPWFPEEKSAEKISEEVMQLVIERGYGRT